MLAGPSVLMPNCRGGKVHQKKTRHNQLVQESQSSKSLITGAALSHLYIVLSQSLIVAFLSSLISLTPSNLQHQSVLASSDTGSVCLQRAKEQRIREAWTTLNIPVPARRPTPTASTRAKYRKQDKKEKKREKERESTCARLAPRAILFACRCCWLRGWCCLWGGRFCRRWLLMSCGPSRHGPRPRTRLPLFQRPVSRSPSAQCRRLWL